MLKQFNDYHFVDNEYPIKIGDRYYKIDLFLYNMEYECYVVVELKIDKHKKKTMQNKTIGIILCYRNNKLLMEYSSNPNIIVGEYIFN